MKLNSLTRCTIALIDSIKSTRHQAAKRARNFRKEFTMHKPKARWARLWFTAYQVLKESVRTQSEILRDHFAKMIKTLTIKPRFSALEVAA